MDYLALRGVHIGTALLSVVLFTGRSAVQLAGIDWRRSRALRIIPHLNDTLLLASAIALAVMTGATPWSAPWLGAKVIGLLIYIVLGFRALRPSLSRSERGVFTVLALLVFAWIAGAAVTRSPAPWI